MWPLLEGRSCGLLDADPRHIITSAIPATVQDRLFAASPIDPEGALDNSTVFTPNMRLAVHRWFRYSAGFSAAWAERVIRERQAEVGDVVVLDPFVGSGTTLIASQMAGIPSFGLESHPLVTRVAQAKLAWRASAEDFEERTAKVLATTKPTEWANPPALLAKIYPAETLGRLLGLRRSVEINQKGDDVDHLLWLALVAILRVCSPAGTAPWQYVLPKKTKANAAEPLTAFEAQARAMVADMRCMPRDVAPAALFHEDARSAASIPDDTIDLVVTSPPYPNNYDYADATRIEMTFLGEIECWGDLQRAVRAHLVRSCSQHMVRYDPEEALEAPELALIRDELHDVYDRLTAERDKHGGRKAYNAMVVAYFHDLARAWLALRRVCRHGSRALFIVGDSAPYAVHVPVERWLGELAVGAGFDSWQFEKLRDRNIKWKNRKHRVPLHEGLLTVDG
jgi:DNA modification methylase